MIILRCWRRRSKGNQVWHRIGFDETDEGVNEECCRLAEEDSNEDEDVMRWDVHGADEDCEVVKVQARGS